MQKQYSFDKITLVKIGKGALIAAGGAILTYIAEHIGDFNFGIYTPIAVAVLSILINAGKEYISGE